MALVIPDQCANWHLTFQNANGGASARSSIAIGTFNSGDLDQTAVSRVANLMRDNLKTLFDSGWLLGPVHVQETVGALHKVWDDTGTEAGTHADQAYAPPGVAIVVTKSTGLAGRAHRGRCYLPGVAETGVDEAGIIFGSYVNEVTAAFTALQIAMVADAAINALNLFHDENSPDAGTSDEIVSFFARTVAGSMRPRQRR